MTIEIKHRWSGEVIKVVDAETLVGANLRYADLRGANLSDADLRGANLSDADLSDADLEPIKNDMWVVLLQSIPEIPALKAAIKEGRIDGSTYSGECACLAGTVAKTRGVTYTQLGYADTSRPIERFFLSIKEGDTPETSQFSKLALEWLEEFETLISKATV